MELKPERNDRHKKPIYKRPGAVLATLALAGLVLVGGRALMQPAPVYQPRAAASAVLQDNDPALVAMHTGVKHVWAGPQDIRTGPDGRSWVVLHFQDDGMVDGDGVIVEVAGMPAMPIPSLPGPPGEEVLVPLTGEPVTVTVTATSEGTVSPCTFAVTTGLGRAYSLPLLVGQTETFVVEVVK